MEKYDGEKVGEGYSGYPPHTNDPESQSLRDLGPIPQGMYKVAELIMKSDTHGPYVLRLEPLLGTEVFGRSGFLIHGERLTPPEGLASHGCIILPRAVRELIWESNDHGLEVIP